MGIKKLETLTVQQRRRQGETVWDMIVNRWQVRAECDACQLDIVVNLMNLFRLNGPGHCLWDITVPCPHHLGVTRCAGRMVYKAKPPEAPTFGYLAEMRRRQVGPPDATGAVQSKWVEAAEVDNGPWRQKIGPSPPDPDAP